MTLGWVVQPQLVVVDGGPQFPGQRHAVEGLGIGFHGVQVVVTAGPLGGIHGDVGPLQQRLGRLAVLRIQRHARAGRHLNRVPAPDG